MGEVVEEAFYNYQLLGLAAYDLQFGIFGIFTQFRTRCADMEPSFRQFSVNSRHSQIFSWLMLLIQLVHLMSLLHFGQEETAAAKLKELLHLDMIGMPH